MKTTVTMSSFYLLMLNSALAAPIPRLTQQIMFTSKEDGFYQLFVMKPDGTRVRQLTTDKMQHVFPAWSPDGKQIVLTRHNGGTKHLYVMNADGTGATPLTRGNVYDRGAAWSPDGSKIAFTRWNGRDYEICVMDLKTKKVVNLTKNGAVDADPAWSPDGKQLTFASNRGGNGFRVYVMNADGSNVRSLTKKGNRFGYVYPSWSPDGKKIAYTDSVGKTLELFVSNADGSNRRQLTRLGGFNIYASWSPTGDSLFFQHHPKHGKDGVLYEFTFKTGLTARNAVEVGCPMEGGRPSWMPR